ncbi:MAG: S9 family peptidase, partial [Candidatus Marinimicrobia bacterium]|nr:S9 family peptidase [Candidatus Neomarinimicrobiota bacterium]
MLTKLTEANINANMGDVANWFEDSRALLVKFISKERKDLYDNNKVIPTGPTVSLSEGKKAQNPTYQDLLKSKTDEHNFEQLASSEIYKVSLNGTLI